VFYCLNSFAENVVRGVTRKVWTPQSKSFEPQRDYGFKFLGCSSDPSGYASGCGHLDALVSDISDCSP